MQNPFDWRIVLIVGVVLAVGWAVARLWKQ